MLMLCFFFAKAAREHGTQSETMEDWNRNEIETQQSCVGLAPEESSLVAQGGSPENEIVQHNNRPGGAVVNRVRRWVLDKPAPYGAIVRFNFVTRGLHPELPTSAPSGAK